MKRIAVIAALFLAGCVQPQGPAPGAEAYQRPAPSLETDTNVYTFRHEGPNRLGTAAVTVQPTAGPNAPPDGTMSGTDGKARAEAAAAFYAESALCNGGRFALAPDAASRFDAAANAWTVFGRCQA